MSNEIQTNKEFACVRCKKAVRRFFNMETMILDFSKEEYRKKLENHSGMYCPNCDHAICLECLPIIGEKKGPGLLDKLFKRTISNSSIKTEDLPVKNDLKEKLKEKMKNKNAKLSALKCDNCGAWFGRLAKEVEERLQNYSDKVENNYRSLTFKETADIVNDLTIIIGRREDLGFAGESFNNQKNLMLMTIEKIGMPKLKESINVCLAQKQFEKAMNLCDQAAAWSKYVNNSEKWNADIKEIKWLIDLTKNSSGKKIIKSRPKTLTVKANTPINDVPEDLGMSKDKQHEFLTDLSHHQKNGEARLESVTSAMTPDNQSKEEAMSLPLLEQENLSKEMLKDLFEKAFFNVSDQGDTLIIQDQGRLLNKYAVQIANNKQIKFFALVKSKETQTESRINYCNRMNQVLNTLRVYITDDCIQMDWYIPLNGGITEKNVIFSFKYFQSQVDEAIKRDNAGIFKLA